MADELFDLPAEQPARKPAPRTAWARVHTHRACDYCAKARAQAGGDGPRPEVARWRHAGPDGATLLCYRHAREARTGETSGEAQ